jgi:hypothetical protein
MQPLIIGEEIKKIPHLWEMLHARTGATMQEYLETFELYDLSHDRHKAKKQAVRIMAKIKDSGATVLLLGEAAYNVFNFTPELLIHPQEALGCIWRQIPHPIVDQEWYNMPEHKALIELLLEDLYASHSSAKRQ